ncbi:hypothetical protein OG455_10185 [Kitasatospora sp. NBC_01287]|uniref:hypothetical protein n=1 Tax=Kitasatospora sp. NBC_01287 TaxID=2903573 RepID=UPI0022546811|nr:hypothetical protein [Kitasatospora sp. NBC_01287]MCX4745890.1 hypothetical protein [Kitasatospora sp. NBC_01287]
MTAVVDSNASGRVLDKAAGRRRRLAGEISILVHNECPTSAALRAAPRPDDVEFPPFEAKKTAAQAGSVQVLSAYADEVPAGFDRATLEQVLQIQDEMGINRTQNGFLDNEAGSGSYYLSHAEKQASTLNPDDPISVSREMCDNCIDWFAERSRMPGQTIYVTDPDAINVFQPDGMPDRSRPWRPYPEGQSAQSLVNAAEAARRRGDFVEEGNWLVHAARLGGGGARAQLLALAPLIEELAESGRCRRQGASGGNSADHLL